MQPASSVQFSHVSTTSLADRGFGCPRKHLNSNRRLVFDSTPMQVAEAHSLRYGFECCNFWKYPQFHGDVHLDGEVNGETGDDKRGMGKISFCLGVSQGIVNLKISVLLQFTFR